MRLKTHIFVSALTRRVFAMGDFAAVDKKGAEDAGAIFIRQRFRDGTETLYAPAPQNFFADDDDGGRKFEQRLSRAEPDTVRETIDREKRFDPDLWLVEIEVGDIADLIEVVASED